MTILLQRISEGEQVEASGGFGAVVSQFGNLPLRQLSYHARMMALAVRTTILQTYYNPFDEAIEANYIFPLAYGQAVVACEMRIADRIVRAELKERAEARREYAEAIRNGHRASLLEENRPETFSMRVGNIPPGEAIQICIQTVSQLSMVSGEWTLRLPLVVAPRYTSGLPLPRTACGDGIAHDTDQVPDASCVTPPTWLPGFASPVDLRLVVDVDMAQLPCAADWLQQLKSSLHTALVESQAGESPSAGMVRRCRVQLLPGERVNRDFILRGHIDDRQVSSSVVCETNSPTHTTFGITIVPPRKKELVPRQVVYLLDRSGSMQGWKIAAARRGLCRLIDLLGTQDFFQATAFNNRLEVHQSNATKIDGWLAATDANRFEAVRWLSNIDASGGTEMGNAVEFALNACGRDGMPGAVRNPAIVLVTDGQITGEDALLRLIDQMPPERVPRLFCLGVDRAVNASVLERLSRRTGGTFELVESEQRLDEVLNRFASEIASPALTGLTITSRTNNALDIAPANLTTLYTGRSQTIYGRFTGDNPLTLSVRGQLANGQAYEEQLQVPVSSAISAQPLLRALWGKERIRTLEDDLFASGVNNEELKQRIVACSLECGVLSRLTAFIAVDATEKVTDGRRPHTILNPSELPEGWALPVSRLDPAGLLRVPRATGDSTYRSEPFPSLNALAAETAKKMLESRMISQEQLAEAQSHAATRGMDVCGALVHLQYATHETVARSIAVVTGTTYLSVSQLQIDPSVIQLLPESVARDCHVLPIADGANSLTVVMSNPADLETIEKLRFILNREINAFCGAHDEIADAMRKYYGEIEFESADSILQEFTDTQIDFCETVEETRFGFSEPRLPELRLTPETLTRSYNVSGVCCSMPSMPLDSPRKVLAQSQPSSEIDAVIIRMVSLLLAEAVQLRATHIIAKQQAGLVRIEYLIDGKLVERDGVPLRFWEPMIARIKDLAKLDKSSNEAVQTGTITMTIGEREANLVAHIANEDFMIELADAQKLDSVPAAIADWWSAVGVAVP